MASNHPLPTPPGQPMEQNQSYNPPPSSPPHHRQPPSSSRQQTAPASHQAPSRRSRGFSFRSEKSHKSSDSAAKVVWSETHQEKESKRLHSKADPSLAMNEAEPSAVAATVRSSLASLRNMQHKDFAGNPITEPDLSNPTRSRWERPLDTIRSFEAAVDGGYNNRKSYFGPDNESLATWNRRSTYYGGNGGRSNDGFAASRPQSMFRPQSQHEFRQSMWQRGSYVDQNEGANNGYGYYGNGQPPPPPPQHGFRRGNPRMTSDPSIMAPRQAPNVENSSVDRMQAHLPKREPEPVNDYGIGFSNTSSDQPAAFSVGYAPDGNGAPSSNYQLATGPGYEVKPPVPQKENAVLRKPTAPVAVAAKRPTPAATPEKRKSWLSRRFSKG
ncbi:hypothetical protein P8C59_007333 [Phyllachora maydis]|uniref:Uncharacterized protein n=1 Tax=Phyllachora maydis TaxID=1825666 RepID=A0AAD9MDF8_9PEZI|nr:hypothetical protein P8C59_007333 [Phyllachora maydis]